MSGRVRKVKLEGSNRKASRHTRDWLEEGEDFRLVLQVAVPFFVSPGNGNTSPAGR